MHCVRASVQRSRAPPTTGLACAFMRNSVRTSADLASTSAPRSSNSFATSSCPVYAARCSGVLRFCTRRAARQVLAGQSRLGPGGWRLLAGLRSGTGEGAQRRALRCAPQAVKNSRLRRARANRTSESEGLPRTDESLHSRSAPSASAARTPATSPFRAASSSFSFLLFQKRPMRLRAKPRVSLGLALPVLVCRLRGPRVGLTRSGASQKRALARGG